MGRKWALPIPLHLPADDYSPEACELRLHLYQAAFARRRGVGFRVASGTSLKRKNPRRGWGKGGFNRIESMFLTMKHGERK